MVLLGNPSLTLLTMVSKFAHMDTVLHIKTGMKYLIVAEPHNNERLEYCNETYYRYCVGDPLNANIKTIWARCKSEMEDGRFVLSK